MNSKQAKRYRRILKAYGVVPSDTRLQLHLKWIDTGKKRLNKKGDGFETVYRPELCNPFKRALQAVIKTLKSS